MEGPPNVPMDGVLAGQPTLDDRVAGSLAASGWGLDVASVAPLNSERDQNWLMTTAAGRRYVLKVTNRDEPPGTVDLQIRMMEAARRGGVVVPGHVPSASGDPWREHEGHLVWLIDFLPGTRLADLPGAEGSVLAELGRVVGRMTRALAGFEHPAAHRRLQWDVLHAKTVIEDYRRYVAGHGRAQLLDRCLTGFEERVVPRLAGLPRSVVHNDVNDHNVLVAADGRIGIIDFGDAVHTVTVNELAVASAYAMLDKAEPFAVAADLRAGFERERPLTGDEQLVLPELIRTRLAMSVSISAFQQSRNPDNPYLHVSEAPVWRLLEHFLDVDDE
ncbi:phosphotransferase [Amycolatopsis ultiminotia]